MVIQLNKIFQTKDTRLAQYVKRIHKMLVHFEYFSIHQIPRKNNAQADFLAKLASSRGHLRSKSYLLDFNQIQVLEKRKN